MSTPPDARPQGSAVPIAMPPRPIDPGVEQWPRDEAGHIEPRFGDLELEDLLSES